MYTSSEVSVLLTSQHRPHFFTLVCKNCSIYGSIEIFSGSLTTNLSTSSDSSLAAGEFWEHGGFVELLVNDFSAHIELETTVAPTEGLKTYTAHFPPIAFPLFRVCAVESWSTFQANLLLSDRGYSCCRSTVGPSSLYGRRDRRGAGFHLWLRC